MSAAVTGSKWLATPVYLTIQEETYNTKVKLYYTFQVSM